MRICVHDVETLYSLQYVATHGLHHTAIHNPWMCMAMRVMQTRVTATYVQHSDYNTLQHINHGLHTTVRFTQTRICDCSILQHIDCNTLQHTNFGCMRWWEERIHTVWTVTCCNILTATHCNTLQHRNHRYIRRREAHQHCGIGSALQHIATHCNNL